ncbi:hypothetical protein [Psychroflexus montanilacus]|uniref:hypothetical protein n=1 Tax=Psychroflexus montanilacus TaxID=2873598 RepID=UPI001CCB4490|nr:hypothetical protein [Psychroflexus montanilacus]MBZ9651831.1 hypothetical protein [Psychroflexus montanilacus]
MKKTLQILILLNFGLNLSAQNIKINSDFKVDSTEIKIIKSDFDYYAYSTFDNKKTDSLIVTIGNVGTSVTAIKIDLTEKPKVYITLWSDYAEFNGKETLDVELESYDLELNATQFKKGDRIMGRIKGKSKPILNSFGDYQIEFDGEFKHIIGKLMVKKKPGENYRIIDNE